MTEPKALLWPDSVCPMLFAGNAGTDAATYYRMTKKEISDWCREGCSVECGRLLQEKMEKKKKKERRAIS